MMKTLEMDAPTLMTSQPHLAPIDDAAMFQDNGLITETLGKIKRM